MSLKSIKVQLRTKYQMLTDYAGTVTSRPDSMAASVAKRHFDLIYTEYVKAHESLLAYEGELEEEERLQYQECFSEVNRLLIQLDEASAGEAGQSHTPRGQAETTEQNQDLIRGEVRWQSGGVAHSHAATGAVGGAVPGSASGLASSGGATNCAAWFRTCTRKSGAVGSSYQETGTASEGLRHRTRDQSGEFTPCSLLILLE
ncbi:uncharacterized protein LOC134677094 [Cydia fagiglandana]|uniref:uncharacterized protein LOC134664404 n=1 Tax=Cydia fagiglandana TaxID=1458189 RepID=UPI002FEE4CE4